jgi:hypothetical protein
MPTPDYPKIAAFLVGGTPLDFKAYPDGSLVVIAPNGQKIKFTPAEVQAAYSQANPQTKTKVPSNPTTKRTPKAKPSISYLEPNS